MPGSSAWAAGLGVARVDLPPLHGNNAAASTESCGGKGVLLMRVTQKVRKILDNYESDNPGVKTNLARLLMHGRLAGSGKLVPFDTIRRIVESQRPYPAFSTNLARQFDVIEIRRTWHFDVAIRLY